jgi:hypothetical protein
MDPSAAHALDSIDRFIDVGGEIAKSPTLAQPENAAAADDLYRDRRRLRHAGPLRRTRLTRASRRGLAASPVLAAFDTVVTPVAVSTKLTS